jgi:hypothetical protein
MSEMPQSEILGRVQAAWFEYTMYLMNKYPPPEGEDWEFTCPHHKRIDALLHYPQTPMAPPTLEDNK